MIEYYDESRMVKYLQEIKVEFNALVAANNELEQIRATLLVNFGDTKYNIYGFKIEDKGSTLQLLSLILRHLTNIEKLPSDKEKIDL